MEVRAIRKADFLSKQEEKVRVKRLHTSRVTSATAIIINRIVRKEKGRVKEDFTACTKKEERTGGLRSQTSDLCPP